MSRVSMLITISSRKKISEFVKFYETWQVKAGTISLGRGTAASEVLVIWDWKMKKRVFFSRWLQTL